METALFQTPAQYGRLIRVVIYGLPLVMVIAGALQSNGADREGAWVLIGTAVFIFLLLRIILPHRFLLSAERLRVVLGGPFAFNIPINEITAIEPVSPALAFMHGGLRLTTAAHVTVVVRRRHGLDIVISPSDRDGLIRAFVRVAS